MKQTTTILNLISNFAAELSAAKGKQKLGTHVEACMIYVNLNVVVSFVSCLW